MNESTIRLPPRSALAQNTMLDATINQPVNPTPIPLSQSLPRAIKTCHITCSEETQQSCAGSIDIAGFAACRRQCQFVLCVIEPGADAACHPGKPAHRPCIFCQQRATVSQGINDELQINLSGISDVVSGKSYYAWLLKDKNTPTATALLLGKIVAVHGKANLLYSGDVLHTNLLGFTSRVLITGEDANIVPVNPSPDQTTWRYYAELPQTPDPGDTLNHFSLLDHLRNLLAEDPKIAAFGIHGGLSNGLSRNVEKLLE